MRKTLFALIASTVLLAPVSSAQAQVSFGVRIGEPPPPRVYRVPARPGPGYEWIEGYYAVVDGHYRWHNGYWARPPYRGAYWRAPYHADGQYYRGRWEGERERRAERNRELRREHRDDRR